MLIHELLSPISNSHFTQISISLGSLFDKNGINGRLVLKLFKHEKE